jgi:hypothetical protein
MAFARRLVRNGNQAINRLGRAEIIPFNSEYRSGEIRPVGLPEGSLPTAFFFE